MITFGELDPRGETPVQTCTRVFERGQKLPVHFSLGQSCYPHSKPENVVNREPNRQGDNHELHLFPFQNFNLTNGLYKSEVQRCITAE